MKLLILLIRWSINSWQNWPEEGGLSALMMSFGVETGAIIKATTSCLSNPTSRELIASIKQEAISHRSRGQPIGNEVTRQ